MSQPRITLRPPPNVEFVEGYPGIPAGPDRPHAEVRGTIELRLPAQGTKTRWVRVELKRVETLPGGGQNNTFIDFVGQSPVKVWEADGQDWALLRTTDFPFGIRIPESVPPSISLDKGAGIRYELTATICTKGKSKFFFKKKDSVTSTTHPIVIDKHELHSTWPVYAQPDSRHILEDMLVLTVERAGTCYGPGDRVRVIVSFKNDGIPAASLRAFEFQLKETIIFRGGSHMPGKKGAPQVQVTPVGEQKIPVNATIYQGQSHRAELGCFIPQTHTNTSISSARHLDISYTIIVRAVLATGKPLTMELPVTVSNWPRNMSIEAVRRIGPSPALSLVHAPNGIPQMSQTMAVARSNTPSQYQQPAYSTAPSRVGLYEENLPRNERPINKFSAAQTASSVGDPIVSSRPGYDEFGNTAANGETARRTQTPGNAGRRLTLVNAESDPEPDSPPSAQAPAPAPKKFLSAYEEKKLMRERAEAEPSNATSAVPIQQTNTSPRRAAWPSAEDEKQRLYESAKQQALKTQAIMSSGSTPMASTVSSQRPTTPPMVSAQPEQVSPPSKKNTPWPTAEEEKLKLYNAAQDAARRTQAQGMADFSSGSHIGGGSPPASKTQFDTRPTSSQGSGQVAGGSVYPGAQTADTKSVGAQLYQHAMASVSRSQPSQSSAYPLQQATPSKPSQPKQYPTAEEEKAAMRYYEAKRAVDRHQQVAGGSMDDPQDNPPAEGPIAYEDLYPNAANTNTGSASGGPYVDQSPPSVIQGSAAINNALSEKERLRLKYEAEDAAAANGAAAPQAPSPPRGASGSRASPPGYAYGPSPPGSRSQPRPPVDFSQERPLTAAEEKARLKAQMDAEEAMVNGHAAQNATSLSRSASSSRAQYNPPNNFVAPPPPPPLAPRPPAQYIQETREEDARSQVEHGNYLPPAGVSGGDSRLEFGLPFRPFSPLDLGINFEQVNKTPNVRAGDIPPPPLPPKVLASQ